MTLNQLESALALYRLGAFGKAAEYIGISQPALSIQIQKLEDEIDISLFHRTSNPITPTEDGQAFLLKAQEIISGVHQLQAFSQELKADFSGSLTIGIIPTLSPFLVPLFINDLQRDFPKIKFTIKEQMTEQIIQNLRHGALDVGLISTPVELSGVTSVPLFFEKFLLYTSGETTQKTQLEVEDIDQSQLWLLEEGHCFRNQVEKICAFRQKKEIKN